MVENFLFPVSCDTKLRKGIFVFTIKFISLGPLRDIGATPLVMIILFVLLATN